jgi:hypothetical protein
MLHGQLDVQQDPSGSALWREVQANAKFIPDAAGQPALRITLNSPKPLPTDLTSDAVSLDDKSSFIGLTRDNILNSTAPSALTRELLVVRLRQELRKGTSPHTSENVFRADLALLEKILSSEQQAAISNAEAFQPER